MHQALRISEILLDIFGYCSTEPLSERRNSTVLAVLARTCRTFKEPALDLLWEELYDLSALARCLPEACCPSEPPKSKKLLALWRSKPCYTFSRPLNEAEWITLRRYTRRVRLIRSSFAKITEEIISIALPLAPFDDPLFPQLQSLYWNGIATSVLPHMITPSLKTLHLYVPEVPTIKKPLFFNDFGDRCPHMENFEVHYFCSDPMDVAISNLVCRWPRLQRVTCPNAALDIHAISHLSSLSSLKSLKFNAGKRLVRDISHLDSKLVFSSLTFLEIASKSLDTITSVLRYIQLPAVQTLSVVAHEWYISKRDIQPYWAVVREACSSNVLTYLRFCGSVEERGDEEDGDKEFPPDEELLSCVTFDVLHHCTAFANLRGFDVDFGCPVQLSDANLLDLVSPCMEYLLINYGQGWQINTYSGGITLSGLVQLLRKCPSLSRLCLALDTRTFTDIPEGLDISFPARRQLEIDLVDSYILPEFVPGLVSVFTVLGLDPSQVSTRFDWDKGPRSLWESVLDAVKDGS